MTRREALRQIAVLAILSALTALHTWPLARVWRTELLGGQNEDPWMNLWHLDWMRRSLLSGKSPYFAESLHHPLGAELYWHTLAPAKTLPGALLSPWLGGVGSYNLMIASTFVLTGLTTFWLCADRLRALALPDLVRDAAALVGASVFTFSRYHLAHATAHLNLSALEGIPLFVLAYFKMLETGRRRWLVAAGLAAGYVTACDLYYVYYLALFAALWLCGRIWQDGRIFARATIRRDDVRRALEVAAASALGALPFVLPLLLHLRPEPIGYHHGDSEYPADLFSALLPDHLSLWNTWLPAFPRHALNLMQRSLLNDAEGGCFWGVCAPALAVFALRSKVPEQRLYAAAFCVFGVLSLGVYLNLGGFEPQPAVVGVLFAGVCAWLVVPPTPWGRDVRVAIVLLVAASPLVALTAYGEPVQVRIPMPFMLFKHVVPLFGRGGMPVRFLLLSQLALAVLAAFGAALFLQRFGPRFALLLLVGVTLDTKSAALQTTPVPDLEAVLAPIRDDAEPGIAVYTDHVLGQWEESIHHRPVSYARQSRWPVREKTLYDGALRRALVDSRHFSEGVSEPQLEAMRAEIVWGHYKYFVLHTATARFAVYPRELAALRHRLVVEDLGGQPIYADAERQIYRMW